MSSLREGKDPTDLPDEDEFMITSSNAYVAAATVSCENCYAKTEVICIHCRTGTACDEPLTEFTVSEVSAIDDALARQLERWPNFRKVEGPDMQDSEYANHCQRCGAVQDDVYLHSEPGDPFFDIAHAAPGSIKLTPLAGLIRLNGDEHFDIE